MYKPKAEIVSTDSPRLTRGHLATIQNYNGLPKRYVGANIKLLTAYSPVVTCPHFRYSANNLHLCLFAAYHSDLIFVKNWHSLRPHSQGKKSPKTIYLGNSIPNPEMESGSSGTELAIQQGGWYFSNRRGEENILLAKCDWTHKKFVCSA